MTSDKTALLFVCEKHGPRVAWNEGTPTFVRCKCGKACKAYVVDEKRGKAIMKREERWDGETK